MIKKTEWLKSNVQDFWGEIAPCNHLLQIYENDYVFLNSLEGFAGSGILAGDSVIIIATKQHLHALDARLMDQGFDLPDLIAKKQYFPLNAKDTLAKFMINGWPDEVLFIDLVTKLMREAKSDNRNVRAFGEMVALLWSQGNNGATVKLEHLWNQFCENEEFSLFCAYPKSGFTQDPTISIEHICSAHSKIISGEAGSSTEIIYKSA
ncbi:MAG: MEDS domain-containing protein [Bacteroidia bacterium]